MEGVAADGSSDVCMLKKGSAKGPRSEEETDQLQRSNKKSKRDVFDDNQESVEMVLETPADVYNRENVIVDGDQVDGRTEARPTFRDAMKGRRLDQDPPRDSFANFYDEGTASDDDEVILEEEDPLCPTIFLTKAEKIQLRSPWRRTLIIKVIGKSVGYNFLLRRIRMLWRPSADMELVALDNDYFLVKFESMEDYNFSKFEGPWMIIEHYLIVKEWVPDFDPFTDHLKNVLVWVRFPCLPIKYYNSDFLMKIGKRIGRPVKVDYATSVTSRGKYARLCVEVDLSKTLLPKFRLKQRIRKIEYEGLYLVCFKCGIYGHREEVCGKAANNNKGDNQNFEIENPDIVGNFGPWMLATKRPKRNVKN